MLIALAAVAAAALPVVAIRPERGIDDRGVLARVSAPGYRGAAEIELRGQFSRTLPKKSYAIELREPDGDNADAPLLGLPADDDWVLTAGYNDRTLMRNAVAFATSRAIGRYAPRTRFAELRIRGRTRGVYLLTEKLELHAARVPGGDEAVLIELTSRAQSPRKGVDFWTPLGLPMIWEDPDRDDIAPARAAAVQDAVVRAERALLSGRPGAWRRHLHGPSAVDHVLLNELFKNQDAMLASTFLLAPRPRARLRLGPLWDFDISMGARGWLPGGSRPVGWIATRRPWGAALHRDPVFARALAQRWRQVRAAGLERRVLRIVDRFQRQLAGRPVRRDLRRWPAGQPYRPRGSFAGHVRRLERWLVRRIAYMDRRLGRTGAVAVLAKVINGTPGADRLRGTSRADVIRGYGGRDHIGGRGGADRVSGGPKDDRIAGGGGADRVDGGTGEDTISGGGGDDRIAGGSGKDILDGGGGADRLDGGTGGDRIVGGSGADRIVGGKDNDTILVRDGRRDVVRCLTGKDDFVVADRLDSVTSDCETVSRD